MNFDFVSLFVSEVSFWDDILVELGLDAVGNFGIITSQLLVIELSLNLSAPWKAWKTESTTDPI